MNKVSTFELWDIACDSIYWDYILIPMDREDNILMDILINSKIKIKALKKLIKNINNKRRNY